MGGIQLYETTINGSKFEVNNLAADKGVETFAIIAGLAEGALDMLGVELKARDAASDIAGQEVAAVALRMAASVISQIGKQRVAVVPLIKTLMNNLRRDGKQIKFELDFAGDYGTLTQLVAWLIEVNFSSFFSENPLFEKVRGMLTSVTTS